ncbi:hypothetical protein BJX64DRAFT_286028 [Aspergillus heterothallicus]
MSTALSHRTRSAEWDASLKYRVPRRQMASGQNGSHESETITGSRCAVRILRILPLRLRLGIIASVVASDSFIEKFVEGRSHVAGTVVALFTAGAFFGAYGAGFTDPLARRTTLALGSVLFIIGGVLQAAAVNHGMLYFSRILSRFGIGILVEVVPMFQAEIFVIWTLVWYIFA